MKLRHKLITVMVLAAVFVCAGYVALAGKDQKFDGSFTNSTKVVTNVNESLGVKEVTLWTRGLFDGTNDCYVSIVDHSGIPFILIASDVNTNTISFTDADGAYELPPTGKVTLVSSANPNHTNYYRIRLKRPFLP